MNKYTRRQIYESFVDKLTLEKKFISIFLVFGVLFTFLIPPGWNTDEPNHTYRIYQLASGNLFSERTTDPQTGLRAYGGEVPRGLIELYERTGAFEPGAVGNKDKKVYSQSSYAEATRVKPDGQKTDINFSGAALYSPVSYALYMPFAILGSLFSLPFFWVIIICRLAGVILMATAFYFAIKNMPFGKWIFVAVGLLPVTIVQAATVGADGPQLAACIVFITIIANVIFVQKKVKLTHYAALSILGLTMVLIKFTYAPILLLTLLIPFLRKECRNRRNTILSLATIALAIVPGIIWTRLVAYVDINSNPLANFGQQQHFILSHPVTYVETMLRTFFTNEQMPLSNVFGSFIWDSVPLPAIFTYSATIVVVLALFVTNSREISMVNQLNAYRYKYWRIALILISLVTALLIATALYIYSTTLRQTSIISIQSRYFLPVLPLLMLALYGNALKSQRLPKAAILVLSCIVLLGAVLCIYLRLYRQTALSY